MSYIFNAPQLKEKRSKLRNNQTPVEFLLWTKLRKKQLCGVKFIRQYSVGNYVLDFYCPIKRLAIEIDGGQHNEVKAQQYDTQRTKYLHRQGIKVIRFWNNEVVNQIEAVLERITAKISNPS